MTARKGFAQDPMQSYYQGLNLEAGYRGSSSTYDKAFLKQNLAPHNLKPSSARGKTDPQLLKLAARTVTKEFRAANPSTTKPRPAVRPKPVLKPKPRKKI